MKHGFTPGDPRAQLAGKKGGAIRGEQKKRESIAIWLQRFPGVSPEAAREIYSAGYRSGWQCGAKARKRQEAA